MDNNKKLDFIHKMARLGLQHFDSGGTVSAQNIGTVAGGLSSGLGGALIGSGLGGNIGGVGTGSGGLLTPIADALGLTDKFQAGSADIQAGTNQKQLNDAYGQAQTNLNQQGDVVRSLVGQVDPAVQNQNLLAQQYAQQTQGLGPNVARNQLNEATASNVANQAALMASQRGASVNPGLIARQAAQQGAATQQQAAGQAATLGAQQQIAAQNNLANLANQQVGQATGATANSNAAVQNEQNILQGANTASNNAAVNMQSNVNNNNAQTAIANQNANTGLLGSLGKGASAIGGLFAKGGMVNHLAEGGMPKPASFVADYLNSPTASVELHDPSTTARAGAYQEPDMGDMKKQQPVATGSAGELPGAGMVTAESTPMGTTTAPAAGGFADFNPGEVRAANGGLMQTGGDVQAKNPKEKAVAKGNNYANDKIPAMLSEGEIVLPREVTMHKNAPKMAADFVRKVQAKKKGLRK